MPKRQQDNAMNRSIGLRLGVSVESVSLSLHVRPRPPHLEIFDSIFRRRRRPLPALDSRYAEAIERHTLSTLELTFTKPL